jgi:putative FmdB family regulatory protein
LTAASANAAEGGKVPTYQYACTDCGDRSEVVQRFTDDPLTVCIACGGKLRKIFSPVGIVFKGSGFYRNDSRNGSSTVGAGKESSSAAANGSSSTGSESKTGSSSDSGSSSSSDSAGSAGSTGSAGSAGSASGNGKKSSTVSTTSSS